MSRCILLVRVSTQRQQFDDQEEQLYQLALSEGFREEDIIPIAEKESGIKLKEEERRGLNRMKEEISKGDVTCVYCWATDRIGRKKKLIFSIVDYLVERGIQLVIKDPSYMKLLKSDGTIDEATETSMTLFAQIAESEMRNKQARWQRTRKANALKGKWNGGKNIKFGYTLDENNYYIPNEEEANIVRLVYDLYITRDFGQAELRRELASRGIILKEDRVRRILSDISYTGETHKAGGWSQVENKWKRTVGYDITYPPIITMEIFKKAEEKRQKSNTSCYRGKSFYFAKNLIKCPTCGHSVIGYKTTTRYCCLAFKHDNKDIEKCNNNLSMNIICLDSILWHHTTLLILNETFKNREKQIADFNEQKSVLFTKIETAENELGKISAQFERWAELYGDGHVSKEKYNLKIKEIADNENNLKINIQKYKNEISQIEKLLKEQQGETLNNQLEFANNVLTNLLTIDNLQKMYDLVHRYILGINWEAVEIEDKKWIKLTIHQYNGDDFVYYCYSRGENYKYKNWQFKDVKGVKIIPRKLGRNK